MLSRAPSYIVVTSPLLTIFSRTLFFFGAFVLAYLVFASVLGGVMYILNI